MNQKQFQAWLGIAPSKVLGDGHPFKTFKNKQEANDYLIEKGIITKEELERRANKAKLNKKQLEYLANNQIPY